MPPPRSLSDQLALSFYQSFGLPVTDVRPFNTYGPRQSARAVIPTIIDRSLQASAGLSWARYTRLSAILRMLATPRAVSVQAAKCDETIGRVTNIGSGFEISDRRHR